jgi:hypothetical protein
MPQLIDLINFIYARGYVVVDFPGFFRQPFDGNLGQCDICFVKEMGSFRKNSHCT